MLLGLPADHLARIVRAHAIHLDLLDDHVMSTHRRNHVALLEAAALDYCAQRLCDEDGIHDLALDDCVGHQRAGCYLDDLGLGLRVVDHDQLHEAAANVETGRELALAEESHYTDRFKLY